MDQILLIMYIGPNGPEPCPTNMALVHLSVQNVIYVNFLCK
jgi:hypothetical protein